MAFSDFTVLINTRTTISESSKDERNEHSTVQTDVLNRRNMAISASTPFAIYQTQEGIELHIQPEKPADAELICIVSHYQSALRIARQAAETRHQPLVTYVGLV